MNLNLIVFGLKLVAGVKMNRKNYQSFIRLLWENSIHNGLTFKDLLLANVCEGMEVIDPDNLGVTWYEDGSVALVEGSVTGSFHELTTFLVENWDLIEPVILISLISYLSK